MSERTRIVASESPFVFDVTDLVRPNGTNRLAVRVLNPTHQPIDGIVLNETPHDPDYLRRDLLNQKAMRYNAIRFISGVPKRYQLDLADEIGLMVYPEAYAGWCLADSPKMKERYNESVFGMIRRDRNHPCITMWGLLSETADGPVFRHAVSILPKVRKLDDSRVVLLNSGRFDHAGGGAGIQVWRPTGRDDPCVTRNGTDHVIQALGITWQPGQIAFHPGRDGEYAVVR